MIDECKDRISGSRYNLLVHKIALYQAFLAMNYKNLHAEEVELCFQLSKDWDIQGVLEEAINRERKGVPDEIR